MTVRQLRDHLNTLIEQGYGNDDALVGEEAVKGVRRNPEDRDTWQITTTPYRPHRAAV